MNRALRTLALPTAALTALLTVSACGTSPNTSGHDMNGTSGMNQGSTSTAPAPSAAGTHNAADVTFATDMIPHHAQAVVMAGMAASTATNTDIKTLAAAIKAAQGPEIATMSGWLAGWGQTVPTSGGHDMSAMGGSTGSSMGGSTAGGSTGGMMSDQEMAGLGNATGGAFDRMWLQMMTRHHQGAVSMARTQLAAGQNPAATSLAQSIIDGQTAEIATMTRLLATLPS